jgi:excinuclease UvrABC nuclease subunit
MNRNDLDEGWNKLKFCRSMTARIFETNGLYLLTNYDGDILYAGKSINIRRRFLEHLDYPFKNSMTHLG